eukprot:7951281-Pyramimonas_sp.AAC.1
MRTSLDAFWAPREISRPIRERAKTDATDLSNVGTNDETCAALASAGQRGGRPCGALGPPGRSRIERFFCSRTPFRGWLQALLDNFGICLGRLGTLFGNRTVSWGIAGRLGLVFGDLEGRPEAPGSPKGADLHISKISKDRSI